MDIAWFKGLYTDGHCVVSVCHLSLLSIITCVMMMLMTAEKLGGCFIKVEDDRQQYCPLYKSFTSLPTIHVSRPLGVCVFEPSTTGKQPNHTHCSHRQLEAAATEQRNRSGF